MYFWHTNYILNKFIQPLKQKLIELFINNTLSWKTHTEYIKSRLSSAVRQTIRITKYSENDLLFLFPLCNDL